MFSGGIGAEERRGDPPADRGDRDDPAWRAFAGGVEWCLDVTANLLDGKSRWPRIGPLPWTVVAVTAGVVTYYTGNWSGVPMIVIQHQHNGAPLWTRYAHIMPVVKVGDRVTAGQRLGAFANWEGADGGDHLHLDMATAAYTREYTGSAVPFVDPVPILKAHLDPVTVEAMLRRGDG
jgi:hypothetical protein